MEGYLWWIPGFHLFFREVAGYVFVVCAGEYVHGTYEVEGLDGWEEDTEGDFLGCHGVMVASLPGYSKVVIVRG